MAFRKLEFNEQLKRRLREMGEMISDVSILDDSDRDKVTGGACGGYCQVTCAWHCERSCHESCMVTGVDGSADLKCAFLPMPDPSEPDFLLTV